MHEPDLASDLTLEEMRCMHLYDHCLRSAADHVQQMLE